MFFRKPKKESTVLPQPPAVGEVTIVTMPEMFLPRAKSGVSAKKVGAAIMGLGLVILVAAAGWFLMTTFLAGPDITPTSPVVPPPPSTSPTDETIPPLPVDFGEQSQAQTLRATVSDAAGTLVSSARLLIGEGSLGPVRSLQLLGSLPAEPERETTVGLLISGQYEIQPREISFLQPVRLIIEYGSEVAATFPELELRGAIFDAGSWKLLPEAVPDPQTDSVGFTIEGLPAQGYAIIKPQKTFASPEPPEAHETARVLGSGQDTDRDGLTDEEERVFGTDPTRPDTDADSFPDGLELVNLYNPSQSPPARLATSNLVVAYNNPSFGYALFAPAGFLVRATDETNRDVLFTSATGEFIEVSVQDNPARESTEVWFRRQFPEENIAQLRQWQINDATAFWSSDGTNLYLAVGANLYILSYNVGGLSQLNFKSTFEMMARSFRPQGAGIATPSEESEEETHSSTPPRNEGGTPPAVP